MHKYFIKIIPVFIALTYFYNYLTIRNNPKIKSFMIFHFYSYGIGVIYIYIYIYICLKMKVICITIYVMILYCIASNKI